MTAQEIEVERAALQERLCARTGLDVDVHICIWPNGTDLQPMAHAAVREGWIAEPLKDHSRVVVSSGMFLGRTQLYVRRRRPTKTLHPEASK